MANHLPHHVVKCEYDENGKKAVLPKLWCGRKSEHLPAQKYFCDTHHVALAVEGSLAPCKNCIKAIIKELSKEL